MLHGLDLGLTSHPNDVASLFILSDTQGSTSALGERPKSRRTPLGFEPRTFGMGGALTTAEPSTPLHNKDNSLNNNNHDSNNNNNNNNKKVAELKMISLLKDTNHYRRS